MLRIRSFSSSQEPERESSSIGLYRDSMALLADLYEITMAYAYWKAGKHRQRAAFNLFFRRNPFDGGYAVAAGQEAIVDFIERFRFEDDDLDYLATLTGSDGCPLFSKRFLNFLGGLRLNVDIDAVPEGTVVFAREPILRVVGPVLECQLIESALLNLINFQTLITTKAARICHAAGGDPVIEFGLRRAQGIDGAVMASRAAYIGGCAGTSNVMAARMFGIPARGTHAHSWVMSFDTEREAFEKYVEAMPNNAVMLVDTYATLDGVENAIAVGKKLRAKGHELIGVRLDSGDLAQLSIAARRMLDMAGFEETRIYASNDLDEHVIESLKLQGAKIDVWGVGTKLVTAFDDPALGGVYKLGAIEGPDGTWQHRVKLSDQGYKTTLPGRQQIRRFYHEDGRMLGDAVYDIEIGMSPDSTIVDFFDPTRVVRPPKNARAVDLLVPLARNGRPVAAAREIEAIRAHAQREVAAVPAAVKRLLNPHLYPVGVEHRLHTSWIDMKRETRGVEEIG